MLPRTSIKRQRGFFLQLGILASTVALSIIMSTYLMMKSDQYESQVDQLQGQRIATLLHAIKNASRQSGALAQWNQPGQPFQNGAEHIGTMWLKPNTCGGTQTSEFLFCDFEDSPRIGDNMQYKTEVTNDGTQVELKLTVSNTAETRGFDFSGENGVKRSCTIARIAGGGLANLNSGTSISQVDCDFDTGIITMDITWGTSFSDDLSIHGTNSPLATIDWNGQDVDNMDRLEVSSIVDRENPVFRLDLNGTSNLNNLNVNSIDANSGTIDTLRSNSANLTSVRGTDLDYDNADIDRADINRADINNGDINTASIGSATIDQATVRNRINQTNSSQMNNFAGGLAIGTGSNISTLENGSLYVPGAVVDFNDPSMFFDPNGVSRTRDIRLTSRGGVALSNLTSKYVHQGSATINGVGAIKGVNCGDGAGYAANRIVVDWQDSKRYHSADGVVVSDYSLNRIGVTKNASGSQFLVRLYSYNFKTKLWETPRENRALATIYCYYP
ncbi:hypothetical protein J0674_20740 [Vibrio parahaemolyticus]|uniref:hypothetical protein n=3 Tax=Vibrionaceae TaxID=641 RepID=UPI000A3933D7|nr:MULTISPECIES: hypothetical protein [Vibrio]EJG1066178.1 hypothetical protein [Vibrio parahaemolyticus O1]MBO0174648.1 hypothetical protein [Vibrio parahaemolyticus]OUD49894.1 hypothetical protein BTA15_20070 [Vibrio parahaemolyticus]HCG6523295.1 hypothetical protein [Vibrio parahaemolyticus]HCG6653657.1 hypothetical protein [Vibrio parahaemolyticus]